MPRVSPETLKKLTDFINSLSEDVKNKCSLCNTTLTDLVKKAEVQTGAGTATVTRVLAERINKTAAPGDRVSERSLVDKVRNVEGKRIIDNVNNKQQSKPPESEQSYPVPEPNEQNKPWKIPLIALGEKEILLTANRIKSEKKKLNREIKAIETETAQKDVLSNLGVAYDIRVCSCKELFTSGIKPDVVLTDPPYSKEFLEVFSELAEACKDVPLVAVMSGQSYLPEVMERLCKHLKYRWMISYLTPGGQAVQQWPVKVNTFWKPVILFGEAIEWFGDVAQSKANDNDKRFHYWGQSESGMADLINRLTKPGQLICDPFLGGGATAITSLSLGRRFVGCDIDEKSVKITTHRLKGMVNVS